MAGRASAVERSTRADAASLADIHAGAWLAWLTAVAALAFLTSNTLYIALAFIAVLGVYATVADSPRGRAMLPIVLFGIALAVLSIPFNLVTGSNGDAVLFELPSVTFPDWFGGVTLGGEITGESLLTAGSRALGIATLVVAAAVFNSVIDHFRLLKLAPPALAQVMIVFTIAVLVVPQGITRARSVAEGRRLRGRSIRGVRAIASLVLPVLQGALEGAVQRAESLESRGFGGGIDSPSKWKSFLAVAGLGLLAWGAFSYYYHGSELIYVGAISLGALAVVAALYSRGRRERSVLRRPGLARHDWILLAAAGGSAALILALRLAGTGDVTYLPYPDFDVPAFHPAGAIAAMLLIAPAFFTLTHD